MELLLQALDEFDDLVIGMRQASMPWLASLLHFCRLGADTLRPAARTLAAAMEHIDAGAELLRPAADAAQAALLDLRLPSAGGGPLSVRKVTE